MHVTIATDASREAAESLRFSLKDFVHLPEIDWWHVPLHDFRKEASFGKFSHFYREKMAFAVEQRAAASGQRLVRSNGPDLISIAGRLSTGANEIFVGIRVKVQDGHKPRGEAAENSGSTAPVVKAPSAAPLGTRSDDDEPDTNAGVIPQSQRLESDEERLRRLMNERLEYEISNSTGTLSVRSATCEWGDMLELGPLEKINVTSGVLFAWGLGYTLEKLPEETPI